MGVKLINESSLVAIGDAIRAKNGSNSTYSPAEMATAISNISSGQTIETLPYNFLNISGNLKNLFQGVYGSKMIRYKSQIITSDVTNIEDMFANIAIFGESYLTDLSDLVLNFKDSSSEYVPYGGYYANGAFRNATYLEYLPVFNFTNTGLYSCSNMFLSCNSLKSVDQFMNNGIIVNNDASSFFGMFQNCFWLRHIPHLEKLKSLNTGNSAHLYNRGLQNCYRLEEALNVPVDNVTLSSSSVFNTFVNNTHTLSRFTFQMNGNTPIITPWKSLILDLSTYVGYWLSSSPFYSTENIPVVSSAADYEQYKNGVYYTYDVAYSRYNHDSAVETINSLPDCSGTGTCTIKFKGANGSATDGGAISNLTSAEIAVATAKGWNVQIV